MSIAVMFIFAILYFGIMQDVGLFNPIIKYMIKITSGNVIAISIGTVIVAAIAHLDGSGASTFLITIPALLPLYKHLDMSPYLLLLLVSASASIMNMVPWGGPLGRAASVIGVDPTALWHTLIPVQAAALAILICMATILGMREKKRIKFKVNDTQNSGNSDNNKSITGTYTLVDENVDKPKSLWFNALLTLGLIATLMSGIIPAALIFMIAVSISLTVNFPNVKSQFERIKAHSPSALLMASIILAAGVFLGILTGTKMLDALAVSLTTLLPTVIIPYLHIIIGFFGVPFELILNTDAYYFALLPVVEQVVHVHGVSAQSTAYAMLIGNIVGTFISPFSPALWLALGLAGLEMGKHIMYSFFWLWGFSIVILIIAMLMGVI